MLSSSTAVMSRSLALAAFFFYDLKGREQALKRRESDQISDAWQDLVRSFGGFLVGGSLELLGRPTEVAEIYRRLLRHPVRNIIDDGSCAPPP